MESPSMLAPTTNAVSASSTASFVHRHYILLKAHYFLFFSAFGILYPILNITLRSRGLSNSELAYINLIVPFLVFFTNPLLGFIADHSRRYLLTFNCILLIVTILYGIMFISPTIKSHNIDANIIYDNKLGRVLDFCASQEVATKCSSRSECGCSYSSFCRKDNSPFNFTFTMSPNDTRLTTISLVDISASSKCGIQYRVPVDKYLTGDNKELPYHKGNASSSDACEITCSIDHFCHGPRHPRQLHYILLYSLLFIIGTNLLSIGITIGVSIGFATLSSPEIFGEQRVFGTIGFGLSAFLASRLYAHFHSDLVYIIMFSTATLICIGITSLIRIQPRTHEENTNVSASKDDEIEAKTKTKARFKAAALIPLLKNIDVIIFLSLTFIWGMSYAPLDPVRIRFKILIYL
ncbi:unnamed protein product [Rotaria socialis]|uniref:Major facilitator superfamily associated domain-containing protein n=1 Tax=Rotaria socialis TaxID=392032 RepID=A0A820W298_9BILA|nr:unnamed protein product [Rotaria socialis]